MSRSTPEDRVFLFREFLDHLRGGHDSSPESSKLIKQFFYEMLRSKRRNTIRYDHREISMIKRPFGCGLDTDMGDRTGDKNIFNG